MKEYIYTDGVDSITLAGGMVRLNLFHYDGSPTEEQQELPRVVNQQMVLPPAAFMRAFESMQRFVEELEKSGVVHRNAPSRNATPTPAKAISPNFE